MVSVDKIYVLVFHKINTHLKKGIVWKQLYAVFPISAELPHKLNWTHFVELLKIDDPIERSFYTSQTMLENWSTTELIRQKKASLFLRLAVSKDKDGILKLAKQGQIVEKPKDLIREPYL